MNSTDIDVVKDVRSFIETHFLFSSGSAIEENTSFMECGILDSTGILELISFLQENYKITIEDEEMLPENLDSLSSISMFVKGKLQLA
ncbi:MAG: acyl carrier protein [Chitinispirillaceae bacterium]|nr:acyl carrier protein [Chitinispirillaceae bacterium]